MGDRTGCEKMVQLDIGQGRINLFESVNRGKRCGAGRADKDPVPRFDDRHCLSRSDDFVLITGEDWIVFYKIGQHDDSSLDMSFATFYRIFDNI